VGAVDQVLDRLLKEGLVSARRFKGCSENEIREIMADQQVVRLPAEYVRFLQRIGKGAGPYLCGTDTFYPQIITIEIRAAAADLFRESDTGIQLSPDAFVFAMHQGYQVFWFPSVMDDDPKVIMYQEGDKIPCREWESFSTYLRWMTKEIER
jgi:SMI1-KNR4 cell-wall